MKPAQRGVSECEAAEECDAEDASTFQSILHNLIPANRKGQAQDLPMGKAVLFFAGWWLCPPAVRLLPQKVFQPLGECGVVLFYPTQSLLKPVFMQGA